MEPKLKKLLSLCLSLLLAGLLPAAAWAAPSVSASAAEPAPETDAERAMGYLPSEGELRFSWELEPPRRALLRAAPLPERYGFTENGDGTLTVWNQTEPKNQYDNGACLFFRGAGAVESYLLLHGAEYGVYDVGPDVDISEIHGLYATAFYGLSETDYANSFYGDSVNLWPFFGTYEQVWMSYAMRGGPMGGMLLETDDPAAAPTADLSLPPAFRCVLLTEKLSEKRFVTVENIPFLTGSVGELNSENWANSVGAIQKGLLESGCVMCSMGYYSMYFNDETSAYHMPYDGLGSNNHAALIVGWDDAYPAENFLVAPPGNGAWLVKNSWGAQWGIDGYFWVSYYDRYILSKCSRIDGVARNDPELKIYDAAPTVNTLLGKDFTTVDPDHMPIEFYGVYPVEGGAVQLLESLQIGFSAPAIFDLYIDTHAVPCAPEDLGTPEYTDYKETLSMDGPGFYTLELAHPVELTGDYFAVYIRLHELSDGSYPYIYVDYLQSPELGKGGGGITPKIEYNGTQYESTLMRSGEGFPWKNTYVNENYTPTPEMPTDIDTLLPGMRWRAATLSLDPGTKTMVPGMTRALTARCGGLFRDAALRWSVSGGTVAETAVSPSGVLTVGADEEAETLNVTVSATVDGTIYSDSAEISVCHDALYFTDGSALLTDYTFERAKAGQAAPLTVTVVNAYTVEADVELALPEGSAFTLSDAQPGPIPARGSTQFTVTPRADLAPGSYTETLTASCGGHSAKVTLTVPVCVVLTLEEDGFMGNMTGEAGLYLPGEAAGVSAARQTDTVAWIWTANGVETPTMFSFDHQIASPGTDTRPNYVMPETDVTLRATGIKPVLGCEPDPLVRGGSFELFSVWCTEDGEPVDYDEPIIIAITDESSNDLSEYFVTTWEDALEPGESYTVTASAELPDTIEEIRFDFCGEWHPDGDLCIPVQIVDPEPEPFDPDAYVSAQNATVIVPVSGEDESVNVTAEIKGGAAAIRDVDVDRVLSAGHVGTVDIDLSGLEANITEVVIPGAMLAKIADAVADEENTADGLEIKLPTGSVTFDVDAVATITEQADGNDLKLNLDDVKVTELASAQQEAIADLEIEVVLDAYLTSNGKRISDFNGGSATVSIPYALKEGQTPQGLVVWYVAADGTRSQVPARYDGKNVVFAVPHFSNYVIAYDAEKAAECPKDETCPISAFTDADPATWYHDGVHFALENGLMNGMGNGKFAPHGNASRAMIVTILYRLEGEPDVRGKANPFEDVADGTWYTDAVIWAAENKIVEGDGKGHFNPAGDITREQLAAILYRYEQSKGGGFTGAWMFLLDYPDAAEISSWADEAMYWCVMQKIINGKDGKLVPGGDASRAEAATMLMRYCTKTAE